MDASFASPEPQIICRSFRDAMAGGGSVILHGRPRPDQVQDFARCTASGLEATPRRLECRFLYDSDGSALFEQITQQPEYYLTRTESSILAANAARIRELTGAVTLVELGSGNSEKTDYLLRAWLARAERVCYIPVDVSESALAWACSTIRATHPGVKVIGMNYEYQEVFPLIAQVSPALVMLLGSTIGNLAPAEMSRFLASMAASMTPDDYFLVGVDLVKERSQLEAAYNDAAGVTASFTRNLFARMNRELGCAIDTDAIEHVARYDAVNEQIDIFARFTRQQTFFLAPLGRHLTVGRGEMVQIEISRKFRLEQFVPYLEQFGLAIEGLFTDDRKWCALLLLRRMAG
ncbi:MAG: dimethylhistidine N-methyltransferase [Geobacteraceae bacterium GWC2_58_44]|nr:MAG: dimethylhistidine N-methyltransferase [Geobacteraceae bacterium GWC2_58_44]HBG07070.1 L-histidine N(alpha)-methyltransferase [Geobacter sp.]